MIALMALPFLACLILAGIHAYLGLHVLERKVIFVDLALAQMAALGALIGIMWGMDLNSTANFFCSFAFTLLGALLVALTRFHQKIVPSEALIGLMYVFSAALAILILDKAPSQAQHLKDMLVGNILFVSWVDIAKLLGVYGGVGLFHFIFRDKFFAASRQAESASSYLLWDILFFITFGLVVTTSVALAGVLLVFCLLIAPSVGARYLSKTPRGRLFWGWGISGIACLTGITGSVYADVPSGPAIIMAFMVICMVIFINGHTKN